MLDFPVIYKNFNYAEGIIWLVVALAIPFLFPRISNNQKLGIGIASLGFIAFGISDLIEASVQNEIPTWLLAYKIFCGAMMLSGRYTYIGWNKFSIKDRYFLFGLFCLIAVIGIIASRSFI
jgi:hypothetical protein